jgi:hypothetical protein
MRATERVDCKKFRGLHAQSGFLVNNAKCNYVYFVFNESKERFLQFVVLKPFSWRDAFAFPGVNCNAASCFARHGVAKEICSGYWQRNLVP